MRPIPLNHRKIIDSDPYFRQCARRSGDCSGRITIEHSFLFKNAQVSEIWAYVPLCWHHHLGKGLNKEMNRWLALRRATAEDLAKYPKTDWVQMKAYLMKKYAKQ